MAYTTVDLVSAELNGMTIGSTTTPTSTTVETWIAQADSEINIKTGRVWESSVVAAELFDHDGTSYFKFPEAPIISVSTFEYETGGLGADSASWSTLTEGRTSDFILYVTDGELKFTGKSATPGYGKQNVRATYTKGYATTPPYINRLATLIVSKRVVETVINDSASDGGGSVSVGNISITDPSNFGISHLRQMEQEIGESYKTAGDGFVFRPSRVYEFR